jgi:hypothetical protein
MRLIAWFDGQREGIFGGASLIPYFALTIARAGAGVGKENVGLNGCAQIDDSAGKVVGGHIVD